MGKEKRTLLYVSVVLSALVLAMLLCMVIMLGVYADKALTSVKSITDSGKIAAYVASAATGITQGLGAAIGSIRCQGKPEDAPK